MNVVHPQGTVSLSPGLQKNWRSSGCCKRQEQRWSLAWLLCDKARRELEGNIISSRLQSQARPCISVSDSCQIPHANNTLSAFFHALLFVFASPASSDRGGLDAAEIVELVVSLRPAVSLIAATKRLIETRSSEINQVWLESEGGGVGNLSYSIGVIVAAF